MDSSYKAVLEPVSLKEPTEEELLKSKRLEEVVELRGFYESKDSLEERSKVVDVLKEIIFLWIQDLADQKSDQIQSKTHSNTYGAQVLPFGGQALNVVTKGGDIDVVCIAPKFIDRKDFFGSLVDRLQGANNIQSIRKITGAYVPVLQFTIKGIKVDLCLAIVRYERIPRDLALASNNVLVNIDVISVRSMSGIRDVLELSTLLPNQQHFVETLKVIKMWAICHGIHGSSFGYPGGIAWTIMVARVCQMYPLACVSMLVYHFFQVFSHWNWPQPVLLKQLVSPPTELQESCVQWNSKKNPGDTYHLMPVITPPFPEHNCCFTVNSSSKQIVLNHLTQGRSLCEKIIQGQSEWDALFQPTDFFSMYKHYLMVTAKAASDQGFLDWNVDVSSMMLYINASRTKSCGFLESQLRKLVEALQVQEVIQQIHLSPKSISNSDNKSTKWFIGLKLHKMSSSTLDISTPMQQFAEQAKSTAAARGIFQEDMKIEVVHVPRKQLEKHVDRPAVT